ncbi:MAG: hypothetical protein M3N97_04410 [Pseudomonadota bacterium]|nr:hypothetical protein [Pseudomonadota bacterium]
MATVKTAITQLGPATTMNLMTNTGAPSPTAKRLIPMPTAITATRMS